LSLIDPMAVGLADNRHSRRILRSVTNSPYLDTPVEVAAVPDEAETHHVRGGPAATRSADPWTTDAPPWETDEYGDVVDSDVDLHDPAQRRETRPRQWDLVLATSAGGVIGAEARYGLGLAVPHHGPQFPWSTVIINATGCLVIGLVMVVLLELTSPHRLVRPFVGVGVLGGYTTYSTFAVDTERLVLAHRPLVALGYVAVTVVSCGLAVWLATTTTKEVGEAVISWRVRRQRAEVGSRP
jgi:CrcB protein